MLFLFLLLLLIASPVNGSSGIKRAGGVSYWRDAARDNGTVDTDTLGGGGGAAEDDEDVPPKILLQCETGYFPNANNTVCVRCSKVPNCAVCSDDDVCATCQPFYSLITEYEEAPSSSSSSSSINSDDSASSGSSNSSSSSSNDDDAGEVRKTSGTEVQICVPCAIENCLLCDKSRRCVSCVEPYAPSPDGNCGLGGISHCVLLNMQTGLCTACEDQYSVSKGVCIPCSVRNCERCAHAPDECTKCKADYTLTNNRCTRCEITHCTRCVRDNVCSECKSSLFPSSAGNMCMPCQVVNCALCEVPGDGTHCRHCEEGYKVVDGRCQQEHASPMLWIIPIAILSAALIGCALIFLYCSILRKKKHGSNNENSNSDNGNSTACDEKATSEMAASTTGTAAGTVTGTTASVRRDNNNNNNNDTCVVIVNSSHGNNLCSNLCGSRVNRQYRRPSIYEVERLGAFSSNNINGTGSCVNESQTLLSSRRSNAATAAAAGDNASRNGNNRKNPGTSLNPFKDAPFSPWRMPRSTTDYSLNTNNNSCMAVTAAENKRIADERNASGSHNHNHGGGEDKDLVLGGTTSHTHYDTLSANNGSNPFLSCRTAAAPVLRSRATTMTTHSSEHQLPSWFSVPATSSIAKDAEPSLVSHPPAGSPIGNNAAAESFSSAKALLGAAPLTNDKDDEDGGAAPLRRYADTDSYRDTCSNAYSGAAGGGALLLPVFDALDDLEDETFLGLFSAFRSGSDSDSHPPTVAVGSAEIGEWVI